MAIADTKYKDLIKLIYEEGVWDTDNTPRAKYADGSPAYCKSVFGVQVVFEPYEIPLLTLKKMFPTTAVKEMVLFWVKQTVKKEDFEAVNCKIWDQWFFTEGKYKNTLGMSYANQFQKGDRNQVTELIEQIKTNPSSKRLMTSFWDFENVKDKALQECAMQTTWHVRNGFLDLLLYSRSGDIGLGIPFNWYQYKILQMMISNVTGYKPGRLIHQIGNLHYYDRHEESLLEQLSLPEYEQPLILVDKSIKNFYDYNHNHVYIEGYKHGEYRPLEVAI